MAVILGQPDTASSIPAWIPYNSPEIFLDYWECRECDRMRDRMAILMKWGNFLWTKTTKILYWLLSGRLILYVRSVVLARIEDSTRDSISHPTAHTENMEVWRKDSALSDCILTCIVLLGILYCSETQAQGTHLTPQPHSVFICSILS